MLIVNLQIINSQNKKYRNPIKDFGIKKLVFINGNGEIRTLAPLARPTPLAGAPLQPT